MKIRQGFGAIEIILIIAVVAIIGGLGWYALKGKAPQASTSPSPSNQVAADSASNTTSTQTSPSSSEPYLQIKELGVKMKLTSKILDIEYVYDASAKTASFSTKSLTALAKQGGTSCSTTERSLGWIVQTSQPFPAVRNKPSDKDIKTLGGSYYGYLTPDVGCPGGVASNSEALQKLYHEQLTEVIAAFQTLEVIK